MSFNWSYSSIKTFQQCPKKYYHLKIAKDVKDEGSEATIYGQELHKAAEDYVADDKPLPQKFEFIQDALDALKRKPGRKLCEHQMALTIDLNPCGWKDEAVWVRGIADLLIVDDDNLTAWVVDYKTGNNKYPDREQLKLMALMVFAHFPHIRKVNAALDRKSTRLNSSH